jgi:hypothetical protein
MYIYVYIYIYIYITDCKRDLRESRKLEAAAKVLHTVIYIYIERDM